ncbi:uncharacterized protein RHO25_003035 [Cercospora beticola]|uniref:Uncharacterized protein n=1 Tax=Cercospora beticola TaxID=122368 RepID=A0ABZ0NFW1_CERBT|nr:hypothetical protein RHO25_003035 [Cercospora beticola]
MSLNVTGELANYHHVADRDQYGFTRGNTPDRLPRTESNDDDYASAYKSAALSHHRSLQQIS